jgi:predicted ATPase/class 3 adenylate cyclase/Tfp pilus assembly protein PilF
MPEANASPSSLTFLFTDIEGSTNLWEQYPDAMKTALALHDALIRQVIEKQGGKIFKTVGDAFYAVFTRPDNALMAAVESQRRLDMQNWQGVPGIRVRMALNTGTAEERGEDYFGPALNRVSRLLSAGHGGQMLLSLSTKEALGDVPASIELRDLGERRLKDLSRPERIFQVIATDLPADFPPLITLEAVPNNLPTALSSFVGREREVTEIKRLLSSKHLVTLTGAGGCGKTRLSIQVAADLLDQFPNGVWFIELAPLTDPATVPSAIASAMGIREDPAKPVLAAVAESLRNKSILLILDNCEHLIGICAEAADTLLRSSPNLKIIASSREALGIGGETIWRVPSLPESESFRLFCERAAAVAPNFTATEQTMPSIVQICRRLDGIPLAIELAAARVNVLHVDQIAARLNDRFRLLTGGSRTALPRQRTLRAAIDWSYDLLAEPERMLFRKVSAFAGGFSLDAAEAVCATAQAPKQDILDLLSRLVEKSLVTVDKIESEARYSLLDMVRQYGRDRLLESGEAEEVGRRHLDYFLGLAERAAPELVGPDQVRWFDRLDHEHENFRAALAWCQGDPGGVDTALRLTAALSRFWFTRGYFEEGRRWLQEAMSRATATSKRTIEWAKALRGAGRLALVQDDYVTARSLFEESFAIFRELNDRDAMAATLVILANTSRAQRDLSQAESEAEAALSQYRELGATRGIATAITTLGMVFHERGQRERARDLLQESLSLFRELNVNDGIAHNLDALGVIASSQGEYVMARSLHEESLAIHRTLGDKGKILAVLCNLGHACLGQGDLDAAESAFKESFQISAQLGVRRFSSIALHNLGLSALKRGDRKSAREYLLNALRDRADLGVQIDVAHSLEGIAALSVQEGNPGRATRLLAVAGKLRATLDAPRERAEEDRHQELLRSLRQQLQPQDFEAQWAAGESMPVSEAIAYALL